MWAWVMNTCVGLTSSAVSRAAGLFVGGSRRLQHLGLVRLIEPTAGAERLGEDALKLRCGAGHRPLGLLERPRLGDRLDRGLDLLVAVGTPRHGGNIPPGLARRLPRAGPATSAGGAPTSAPPRSPGIRASRR